MSNMETVTGRLKDGQGTAGKLLADDSIANNIEEITEDAGGFVRSVTRLQTIVGVRTEYNYLANTFKNYFSIQLAPAARPLLPAGDRRRPARLAGGHAHLHSELGAGVDRGDHP